MIILNEKNYAEECLNHNVILDKPFFTLSIIAKYYYHCLGYRRKKIITLLTDFMCKNYPDYENNKLSWQTTIDKIAASAGKYKLFEIDGVKITKSELAKISEIHNKVLERLMFTMLCLAKLGNERNERNNGWVNTEVKDIFTLARISATIYDQDLKINQLYQLGLIEFPKRNDLLNIRVTFIDNKGDEELYISDFRELGYEYLKYNGEHFSHCQECGILMRQNKNRTRKYCNDCGDEDGHLRKPKTRIIICIDCGRRFEVPSNVANKIRCDACQYEHNKENKKIWESKNRK